MLGKRTLRGESTASRMLTTLGIDERMRAISILLLQLLT